MNILQKNASRIVITTVAVLAALKATLSEIDTSNVQLLLAISICLFIWGSSDPWKDAPPESWDATHPNYKPTYYKLMKSTVVVAVVAAFLLVYVVANVEFFSGLLGSLIR